MTNTNAKTDRYDNRAPKGGAISPVNNRFYLGGQWMPKTNKVEVKPAIIEIKGALYEVKTIDPGFAGVAALEVTKVVSGESYAVVLEASGRVVCECPSYLYTHESKGSCCKHGIAVIEAGLLRAPVPAPVIEPGVTYEWDGLASDNESAGLVADDVDHWTVLALRVA